MSFKDDLIIENNFYNNYFKKWLLSNGYNLVWVYYDENNIVHKELQKKSDIDVIVDTGKKT